MRCHLLLPLVFASQIGFAQSVRQVWGRSEFILFNQSATYSKSILALTLSDGNFGLIANESIGGGVFAKYSRSGTQVSGAPSVALFYWATCRKANDQTLALGAPGGNNITVDTWGPSGAFVNNQTITFPSASPSRLLISHTATVRNNVLYVLGSADSSQNILFVAAFNLATNAEVYYTELAPTATSSIGWRIEADSQGRAAVLIRENNWSFVRHFSSTGGPVHSQVFNTFPVKDLAINDNDKVFICQTDAAAAPTIIRYAPDGTEEQRTTYSGDFGEFWKLRFHPSGDLIAAGISSNSETMIARITPGNLNKQWITKTRINGFPQRWVNDIGFDASNEIYVANLADENGTRKIAVQKYSTTGVKRFGISGGLVSGDLAPTMAIHRASGDVFLASTNGSLVTANIFRQAPTAILDGFLVRRNQTYNSPRTVTTNDRNWQGATVNLVTGTSKGTLFLNSNGTFRYIPNAGATGTDSFRYRLVKSGLDTSEANVQLTLF